MSGDFVTFVLVLWPLTARPFVRRVFRLRKFPNRPSPCRLSKVAIFRQLHTILIHLAVIADLFFKRFCEYAFKRWNFSFLILYSIPIGDRAWKQATKQSFPKDSIIAKLRWNEWTEGKVTKFSKRASPRTFPAEINHVSFKFLICSASEMHTFHTNSSTKGDQMPGRDGT